MGIPNRSASHWYRSFTLREGLTGSGELASAATPQPICPACRAASLRQRTISSPRSAMSDCGCVANSSICPNSSFSNTVLAGIVLGGTGEDGRRQRLRDAGVRIDQKEFLLHSDGAHVVPPLLSVPQGAVVSLYDPDCPLDGRRHLRLSALRHQPHGGERRQGQAHAPVLGLDRAARADPAATEADVVGVQLLAPDGDPSGTHRR